MRRDGRAELAVRGGYCLARVPARLRRVPRERLYRPIRALLVRMGRPFHPVTRRPRSEEHTSELQSRQYLVCRLLLEKKKKKKKRNDNESDEIRRIDKGRQSNNQELTRMKWKIKV